MRFLILSLVILFTATLSNVADAAHPFHVSLAEVEWNHETGKLEVALRVHPDDLELAIRRHSGLPINLNDQAEPRVRDYVNHAFVARRDSGQRMDVEWVGMEITVKEAWLYFEIPLKPAAMQVRFSNRFFFELQADQANKINFRNGTHRVSVTCTRERAEHVVSCSAK